MFPTNLVVHNQEHGIIYCITQFGTIGTIVPAQLYRLYMFRKKLVVHHQEHSIIYYITQYNRYNCATTIVPIVPNCAIQYIMPCSRLWRTRLVSKHVEQTKNCGIKVDYKNCASRWSLIHCNMMRGTHSVKFFSSLCLSTYARV